MIYKFKQILKEYSEKNTDSKYEPAAVGKYGIRKRTEIYKKELSSDYSKNKLIFQDTLTIGMGSKQIDFGVQIDDEIYSVSPAYKTFYIDTTVITSEYLKFYLLANNETLTQKYMVASARQGKKVDVNSLFEEEIEIPSFEEQQIVVKKINDILYSIQENENLKTHVANLLGQKFTNMFAKIKEKCKASDVILYMRNGVSPSTNGTITEKVLTLSAVTQGRFNKDEWKTGLFVSSPNDDKRVCNDDLYICRGNGNIKLVGKAAFSKENLSDLIFPDTVIAAKVDLSKVNLRFLLDEWNSASVRAQIEKNARTTNGTYKVNQDIIGDLNLTIPSLEKQKEYCLYAEAIDVMIKDIDERISLLNELLAKILYDSFMEV